MSSIRYMLIDLSQDIGGNFSSGTDIFTVTIDSQPENAMKSIIYNSSRYLLRDVY